MRACQSSRLKHQSVLKQTELHGEGTTAITKSQGRGVSCREGMGSYAHNMCSCPSLLLDIHLYSWSGQVSTTNFTN